MKKRILHILGALNIGGTEKRILDYHQYFVDKRLDIVCDVFTTKPINGNLEEEFLEIGSGIYKSDFKSKPLQALLEFYRLVKKNKYDIVHSHIYLTSGIFIFLSLIAGVPKRITQFHSTHDGKRNKVPRIIYRFLMRILIWVSSTDIIGISHTSLKRGLGSFKDDSRCDVIYNGIDYVQYNQKSNQSKQKLFNAEGKKIIVSVARMVPVKNHQTILDVISKVKDIEPNILFIWVGDGPERQEIELKIKNSGLRPYALLTGFRDDIAEVLSASDIFFLPSLWEGLGSVYLEALASGLPIVASNLGPIKEISHYFPNRCYLSEPCDVESHVNNIIKTFHRTDTPGTDVALLFQESPFRIQCSSEKYRKLFGLS